MNFDISLPPPTRQELAAEQLHLNILKKQQIRTSIISDGGHGLLFLFLYLNNLLSGTGLLLAIIWATSVAFALASSLKKQLNTTGIFVIALAALSTMTVVTSLSIWILDESLSGGCLSGIAAGSMVTAGAIIGRKFFHVFSGLEALKNVAEDELALQELTLLCRKYPQLADYRQQALDILRPNLTFGELQAMRLWVAKNAQP